MNRAVLLLVLAGCAETSSSREPPAIEQDQLFDLVGRWRWLHRVEDAGTVRIEDEQWLLQPTPSSRLEGHYVRTVDVRTTDQLGFPCNQRLAYRQRAVIRVVAEEDGSGGFTIRETGYDHEASPCDHGFRHLTEYRVVARGTRMELHWDGGSQTLWHVGPVEPVAPAFEPAPKLAMPTGAWRWQTRSVDDDRHVRDEAEWWEFTRRGESTFDATYRRRVTVRSIDGSPIACAGAPSYSFDDAYVLEGKREEEHWRIVERGFDAGTHPCLAPTPHRALDEATAEQIGDHVVLEWRGKRRQVLHRPDQD